MSEPTISDLKDYLQGVIETANQLNANGQPTRSRELSLAITNAEQALMWLEKCPVVTK